MRSNIATATQAGGAAAAFKSGMTLHSSQQVTVSGTGFSPGAYVDLGVTLGSQYLPNTASNPSRIYDYVLTDSSGSFSVTSYASQFTCLVNDCVVPATFALWVSDGGKVTVFGTLNVVQ